MSLRQIANQTKISVGVLEALERNDISRLPGGIFSRAFVRAYAAEVGLDPDATIQDFVAQFPHDSVTAGHPTSRQVDDNEAIESERQAASTTLWILLVSIPLAGAVLYFSMGGRRIVTGDPLEPPSAPPASESAGSAPPASANTPAAAGHVDAPVATTAVPAAAAAAEVPAKAQTLTVGLSASRPVWVSATVDGSKAIERLLRAGDRETVEVARELVLTAGDAAALSLTLNGAEARALGRSGEVVTTRLNPSNFREYLQVR